MTFTLLYTFSEDNIQYRDSTFKGGNIQHSVLLSYTFLQISRKVLRPLHLTYALTRYVSYEHFTEVWLNKIGYYTNRKHCSHISGKGQPIADSKATECPII